MFWADIAMNYNRTKEFTLGVRPNQTTMCVLNTIERELRSDGGIVQEGPPLCNLHWCDAAHHPDRTTLGPLLLIMSDFRLMCSPCAVPGSVGTYPVLKPAISLPSCVSFPPSLLFLLNSIASSCFASSF